MIARIRRRRPVAVFAAIGLLLAATAPAAAHAVLVHTDPADGAVLDRAPGEVVLHFNETVTPVALRVIGSNGTQVRLQASAMDRTLRAGLPDRLAAGSYLVSWRAISADAHPIGGAFAFSVGTGAAPPAASAEAAGRDGGWLLAVIANRAMGDAALLVAAGGLLCAVLVFGGAVPRRVRACIAAGAAVAALSALASVPLACGWADDSSLASLFESGFCETRPVRSLVQRVAAILIGLGLAAIGLRAMRSSTGAVLAVGGAVIACAGMGSSGHVRTAALAWLAQAGLMLHAVAASFWVGSLYPLWHAARHRPPGEALDLLRRFSALAVPAVALLVLTGIGVALTQIATIDGLIFTDYGRLLLLKAAFVALLIAVAARNRNLVRARAGGADTVAQLARNIRLEIGCAGAVLLVTAILGHTSPEGRHEHHDHHDHAAAGQAFDIEANGRRLRLELAPARRGPNRLSASLRDAQGRAIDAREVTALLSLPEAGIEPLPRVLSREGEVFALDRVDLPVGGRWQIRIEVLVSDFEKATFTQAVVID